MKYLLVALLSVATAFAQSEPVTRIKGDKDTGYKIAPNLVVPNKQATKLTSTSVRIETGNGNMLPDPSFESGVIPPSTDPSVVGGYRFSCGSYGTLSVGNSAIANDGTKTLKMQYGAGSGAFEGLCAFSTILPDNLAGTDIEFSFEGSMKYDTKICVESYQITPVSLSQPQKCFEFNETGGVNKRFVLPYKPLYRTLSMTYRRLNTSDTTTVREIEMDTVYLGKPKSAEAVMAKFQVDSKRIRVGNATSYITADTTNPTFGTLTVNDLFVTRNGDRALVEYKIKQTTAGTNGSGIYRYALPIIDGVQLKAPQYFKIASANAGIQCTQSGTVFALDSFVRSYASDYQFMVAGININNNAGTFSTSSTVHSSGAYNFGACPTLEIDIVLDVHVPEWSDSYNAALAICEKGPIGCGNVYSATINGTTPSVISANKAGWITSVTRAGTGNFTLNLSPQIGLTVAMSCTANGTTASYAEYETFPNSTTTSIQVMQGNHLPTTNQVANNANFNIICVKNAPDYRESFEKFAGFLPMNDVKDTEWVVGYDWIDNNPIYKRCYKVVSDITSSNANLVVWGANLNPINANNFYAQLFTLLNSSEPTFISHVYYNKSNGQVGVGLSGGAKLGAGSKVCMEYVK